eukprot:3311314-Amphidinium_carterae.1
MSNTLQLCGIEGIPKACANSSSNGSSSPIINQSSQAHQKPKADQSEHYVECTFTTGANFLGLHALLRFLQ